MERGFLNKPKSPKDKDKTPGQPEPSLASTPNTQIPHVSQELRDTLRWMLSERREGLDGPFVFSDEIFDEFTQAVHESGELQGADPMAIFLLVKDIAEEIMKERPVKISAQENSSTAADVSSSGYQIPPGTARISEMKDFHGRKLDYAEQTVVITTIPFAVDGNPDPDGHCEWIVNGPTKARVVLTPGYPAPVPKPAMRKMTIRQTPDMGVGLFATQDIKMDELIFGERPILAARATRRAVGGLNLKEASDQQSFNEELLRDALGRMTSADRNMFLRLRNSHTTDGSGALGGIVRTNSFGLDGLFDGPEEKNDGSNSYTGVLKIGTYINHSCNPNLRKEFSIPSFSVQFYANLDIKAGQELFINYCDTDMSVVDRRKELAPYGFTCHCDACDHATKESDKLRQEYKSKTSRLLRALNWQRREGKKVPQATMNAIIKLKNGLAKEGLVYTHEYKSIVVILAKAFEELGKEDLAKEYQEEGQRYNLKAESLVKYAF